MTAVRGNDGTHAVARTTREVREFGARAAGPKVCACHLFDVPVLGIFSHPHARRRGGRVAGVGAVCGLRDSWSRTTAVVSDYVATGSRPSSCVAQPHASSGLSIVSRETAASETAAASDLGRGQWPNANLALRECPSITFDRAGLPSTFHREIPRQLRGGAL